MKRIYATALFLAFFSISFWFHMGTNLHNNRNPQLSSKKPFKKSRAARRLPANAARGGEFEVENRKYIVSATPVPTGLLTAQKAKVEAFDARSFLSVQDVKSLKQGRLYRQLSVRASSTNWVSDYPVKILKEIPALNLIIVIVDQSADLLYIREQMQNDSRLDRVRMNLVMERVQSR